jgi:hypothetical protein
MVWAWSWKAAEPRDEQYSRRFLVQPDRQVAPRVVVKARDSAMDGDIEVGLEFQLT